MSNNKQSSVEWLDRWFRDNPEATHEEGNAALQQAKAMRQEEHKQFIKNYFEWHKSMGFVSHKPEDIDEYYNETFGGNNDQ